MRVIRNAEEGRELLLSRKPLEVEELPMGLRETTFRTFGQELHPDEVVRRIIRDVRDDGDNAVRYYNTKLDGATVDGLRVTEDEVRDAYNAVDSDVVEQLLPGTRSAFGTAIAKDPDRCLRQVRLRVLGEEQHRSDGELAVAGCQPARGHESIRVGMVDRLGVRVRPAQPPLAMLSRNSLLVFVRFMRSSRNSIASAGGMSERKLRRR
jgi:hypothetical protein